MSTPASEAATNPNPTAPTTNIYEYITSYDFASDPEFRRGLGTILGHPGTPASEDELRGGGDVVLQAKCFYISRKRNIAPTIDFTAYKNWLIGNGLLDKESKNNIDSNQTPENQTFSKEEIGDKNIPVASSSSLAATNKQEEPAYPSSFAHIVDLITNNMPIPGIEEIPDTVLSGQDGPSKASRRRKPWEKAENSIVS